jgi:hypothetical protein
MDQEGRILLAISALEKSEIPSVRQAARVFQFPYTTLQNRLKGIQNRVEKRANGHKLTSNEEESLIQWILSLDRRGAAPLPIHVRQMADILLSKRGDSTFRPTGRNWVSNFIKRRNESKSRFSRRYNYQSAKCEDPKIIQEWFNLVHLTINAAWDCYGGYIQLR